MPLIYKPRDPSYGIRKRKHKINRRRMLHGTILPETREYIESKSKVIAGGRLIDEAIKLYAADRHELKPATNEHVKRVKFGTSVSYDTLTFVQFMRDAMKPGELVDEAIRLYRQKEQP